MEQTEQIHQVPLRPVSVAPIGPRPPPAPPSGFGAQVPIRDPVSSGPPQTRAPPPVALTPAQAPPPARAPGPAPVVPACISRPRPTALGHRGPPLPPRVPASVPEPRTSAPPAGLGPPPPPPSLRPPAQRSPPPGPAAPSQEPGEENKDFRVYIVTWNVGSAVPPDDISGLFGPGASSGSVDMIIVGLQEVNSMINKRLKDVLFSDQWSELCMDTLSPLGFVLVASQRMQGVLLLVFSRSRHLPFLRGVQTERTRTGLGGYWGNKGGVSARMSVFGHPLCFLNCHLPAHMRNLEQRMEDFESILQQQQFEEGAATGVLDHDVVFWFGDLNFRIEDYDIHVVKGAIDSNKLPLLWERDQLNMAKNTEPILEGFLEGQLNFPPTYKFDVGTHTYDTSAKKRKPAWTDRILWRLRRTGSPVPTHSAALQRGLTSWLGGATRVTQHTYRSHMGFTVSDHKPVSALFSLQFPFRVDTPLVELQASREWCKVSDAVVRFAVASGFQRSSWDWVAIYKVGFRHHKDYQASVWAKGEHATQVVFSEEDLPRDGSEYILGFYSHSMNSIVGLSAPLQIRVPVRSPASRRSDSSDASSEDDSTLVLLAPGSRSPSPKSSKHHHHHHQHRHRRSRSPAVPALSSAPLPSLQNLGLGPAPAVKKERLVSPDPPPSPAVSPLSPLSPRSPRSPVSPGGAVSAPEALIVAILGEHRPAPVRPQGRAAETDLA